jgi:hypothetical protein
MVTWLLALALTYPSIRLSAQCPDGSPPPCRSDARRAALTSNSVAVLYFENPSRDTTDVYLADGLTEDVTAKLGQVGRLAVTSRAAGWRDGIPDTMVTVRNVYDPALAAVALGMPELAIGILEHATPRGPWLWSYLIWSGFDPLRNDARFIKIFDESKPTNAPDVPR